MEPDNLWDAIREDGQLVGRQEWDSGGPGAGAGSDDVYLYRGAFYSLNDGGYYGPYDTFGEAAEAVGLFYVNEATTGLWIEPEFRNDELDGRLSPEAKALVEEGGLS